MSILLGNIALTRLQVVEVDEPRHLVELRAPGAKGSVFQDLGRGSLRLVLVGVFLGEQALRDIEVLRGAHASATPLSFSGDIAVGSEITDVIIEHFEIHQTPGHTYRYEYRLRLGEWTEPPRAATEDLALVDVEVAADADQWAAQSQQLAAGLTDPAALASALKAQPGLLARLDGVELAQAVLGSLGDLDAADFAHLLAAVAAVDPDRVIELIERLDEADSLEELLLLVTDEGIDLLEGLTGLDLSQASAAVRAFVGGIDFIQRARDVIAAAQELLATLMTFNPSTALAQLQDGAGHTSTAADIVARAITLLDAIEALIESTRAIDLPGVAADLGVAGTAATLAEELAVVLQGIRGELTVLTALSQLGHLFGLLAPLIGGLQGIFADAGQQIAALGLQAALSIGDAVAKRFGQLQDAVALGSSLALAPAQLEGLRRDTDDVITALEGLAQDFRAAEAGEG